MVAARTVAMVDALVFDFDGLLMDTESTLLEGWRAEWRHHGLRLDESGFFADHGGDITAARYAELAAAVGPGYDRAESHARRIAYRDALLACLGLAPGIREWLDRAEALGLRMAVASSSPRAWVEEHLSRTGDLQRFEVRAFGDEVAAYKPDPAVYRLALARLGLPPQRAVAFEDTPHGTAAAKAAGLRCVAIPNPYADPSRFTAADLVLPSAAGLGLDAVLNRLGLRERHPAT
ncbi:HAD family hydrolase [Dactylosporangium sp. CA-233914]|uniref:HAD family hydrolase n=1 Tax=Dactylosporangium sp. CA-233914 TaxID=3239934 RepID=UPI003D949C87